MNSTLVEMVREYYMEGEDSGIELRCSKPCVVLEGKEWETQLNVKNKILDEMKNINYIWNEE